MGQQSLNHWLINICSVIEISTQCYLCDHYSEIKLLSSTMCSADDESLSSSVDGTEMQPRLDSYEPSKSGFKKKHLEFASDDSKVKTTSYKPVVDITSFDNPAYVSNPTVEPYTLPGVAHYDDPIYSHVDEEEKKLDLEKM